MPVMIVDASKCLRLMKVLKGSLLLSALSYGVPKDFIDQVFDIDVASIDNGSISIKC